MVEIFVRVTEFVRNEGQFWGRPEPDGLATDEIVVRGPIAKVAIGWADPVV
jgi:hypothetical protein